MKLHLNQDESILLITAHAPDRITVGAETYGSSLILTPNRVIPDWNRTDFDALTADDFQPVVDLNPELVLLGTGPRMAFPKPAVTQPLIQRAIGLEVMDTAAACRTYNILAAEGRNVAACLILNSGG